MLPAVRFVQADSLLKQLELGHVVLLSSLAYSAAGEVLNCNSYDVAVHAAVELKADNSSACLTAFLRWASRSGCPCETQRNS